MKTDMEIVATKYRPFFEEAEKIVLCSREVWKNAPYSENELHCKFFIFSLTHY